jgi:hypothetical protein
MSMNRLFYQISQVMYDKTTQHSTESYMQQNHRDRVRATATSSSSSSLSLSGSGADYTQRPVSPSTTPFETSTYRCVKRQKENLRPCIQLATAATSCSRGWNLRAALAATATATASLRSRGWNLRAALAATATATAGLVVMSRRDMCAGMATATGQIGFAVRVLPQCLGAFPAFVQQVIRNLIVVIDEISDDGKSASKCGIRKMRDAPSHATSVVTIWGRCVQVSVPDHINRDRWNLSDMQSESFLQHTSCTNAPN